MASSWWPIWPFGKGASLSHANFFHLSRVNIERIRELIGHEQLLNPHQCLSMSSKLEKTMQNIERLPYLLDDFYLLNGSAALENFHRVSEKAKQLVENCCSVDWCQASAFQIQNEEAFREILLEISLSYNTICILFQVIKPGVLFGDLRGSSTFDPPSANEVFKDRIALQDRLKGLINATNISSSHIRSQHLGRYLLGRVNFALQQSTNEDIDLQSFNLWSHGKGPDGEWSEKSDRIGASVIKTTWLDVPCARKEFEDAMQEDEWLAEAKVLASLNHPNIVKFLCCNKYETIHTEGHYIAMEQMETSLCSFIRRHTKGGAKLSLFLVLDIILQIAYGMCYLHENGVAHRDLKTSNVVCSIIAQQLQYYLQVKIVDFGISKVKLSQDKSNTITRPKIGTTLYMPPEAFSNGRANWFKADVYSFSMMCSVLLSGEEPFQNVKRNDLCATICRGERPKLPMDTPMELASLIIEGWAMDRNSRPNFMDICIRLEKLRHRLLSNDSLHSSGLSLTVEDQHHIENSNLYINNMMKKRSEARELDRSHSRLRIPINSPDAEEWFDGDEEQQQSVQAQQLLQQRDVQNASVVSGVEGSRNGNYASGGLQASPSGKCEKSPIMDFMLNSESEAQIVFPGRIEEIPQVDHFPGRIEEIPQVDHLPGRIEEIPQVDHLQAETFEGLRDHLSTSQEVYLLPEAKRYKGVRYRPDRKNSWSAEMKQPKIKNKMYFGDFKSAVQAARAVDCPCRRCTPSIPPAG